MALAKLRSSRYSRTRRRVLICTPEITELPEGMGNAAQYIRAKGGGLGDISAGLIQYLHAAREFDLHIVLPRYDAKIRDFASITHREVDLLARLLDRRGIHLVTDSAFASLADVYGDSETHPRVRRALAFQRHIINELIDRLQPDVVHCNDWMTGLVPAAARAKGIKSLFTLHNVFTEFETPREIDRSGIDVRRFQSGLYYGAFPEYDEAHWKGNRVDFTASGIHAADYVNTVSESFLEEVVRGDFESIVPPSVRAALRTKHSGGRASGILNAPGDALDPRISPHVTTYDVEDVLEKKRENKERFQAAMGLLPAPDAPLFLWPSRLYSQKSPELLIAVALRVIRDHGAQIALVANGERSVELALGSLQRVAEGRLSHHPFAENLSLLGMAGSDFVLMPSLYEPCGLPQMIGPRFGTLPVARMTGGLRDTVQAFNEAGTKGNGFCFDAHSAQALGGAMDQAVAFFRRPAEERLPILQRVMTESLANHTLERTAEKYVAIYEKLISERTRT